MTEMHTTLTLKCEQLITLESVLRSYINSYVKFKVAYDHTEHKLLSETLLDVQKKIDFLIGNER